MFLWLYAAFVAAKRHTSHLLFDQNAPWFWRSPFMWFGHHLRLAELIWVLERRHIADPAKTGSLPHVNTLTRGNGMGAGAMSMGTEEPVVKDLVLVGAGHSHAFVLKSFGMNPERNVRVTLITDGVDTPYSGMLPGFVSGAYTRDECHIDVVKLAEFAKARLIVARAVRINSNSVSVEGQPDIPFDACSVDVGSSPQLPAQGWDLVCPVKPISKFSAKLERISARDESGEKLKVAVVGGGAGGVELALALFTRLKNASELVLVTKGNTLLPNHSPEVAKIISEVIAKKGERFRVISNHSAESIERSGDKLALSMRNTTGQAVQEEFDEVIWCTHACGQPLLRESAGFKVDENGFVFVDDFLRVEGLSNVFAAGDCAHLRNNPCPKAGVFAVRQGPPLTENLRNVLRGRSPTEAYIPQRAFLGLIGTGDGRAVASKGAMGLEADWLWDLKDWIDRKWMSGYTTMLTPPPMDDARALQDLSMVSIAAGEEVMVEMCESKMRCGGCGSKVGASVLSRVLNSIGEDARAYSRSNPDILVGLDQPDDCAVLSAGRDSMVVETVDFFRSFWRDEYVFAKIAVNHSLSDVHAMGMTPTAALCIAQVPFAPAVKMEQNLSRLMRGALDQMRQDGCALVGGHTCEGKELALGFSVTAIGTVSKDRVMRKGGMNIGDMVILTKPIGTGAIMAANMRLLAKGSWVYAAIEHMQVSNQAAGRCLVKYGATACTDVTGFGLAGHLVEMLRAGSAGYSASIELDRVPLLPGAEECVADKNVVSSLHRDNVRAARLVKHSQGLGSKDRRFPLLFDPQTAGGLLATIPPSQVDACLKELREVHGYASAGCIGFIKAKDDGSDHFIELV